MSISLFIADVICALSCAARFQFSLLKVHTWDVVDKGFGMVGLIVNSDSVLRYGMGFTEHIISEFWE